MDANDSLPQDRLEAEGTLPKGAGNWKALFVGSSVGFLVLGTALVVTIMAEPTMSSKATAAIVMSGMLGILFGYHVAGQQSRRLERENERLTGEVRRIATDRPHAYELASPLSSNPTTKTER